MEQVGTAARRRKAEQAVPKKPDKRGRAARGRFCSKKRRQKRVRLLPQIESPRVLEEEKTPLEKAPFLLSRPASAGVTTSD